VKAVLLICTAALAARAESLAEILARMDHAARDFHNMTASVKRVENTFVLHESTDSSGSVRLRRGKGGLAAILEFGEPNHYFVHLNGRTLEIFRPKAGPNGVVEEYDMRKYAKSMDQFFLLGFGTSAAELQKEYAVTLGAAETIDGIPTTRIDLAPKSGEAKKLVTRIEMWIPQNSGNPKREKVTQTSKDYSVVTYSDLKINTEIPESAFLLDMPKNVKRILAN
jgi:outer membrane lipoprotein-sorting protein